MDALIIFTCLFLPLFVLSALSAGRDQLLFQQRVKASRWYTATAMIAGLAALLALGLPLPWAAALVAAGPSASILGEWVGSGDWIVLEHRLRRLWGGHGGRLGPGH